MTEGTRLKTLDEQVKKLESKLSALEELPTKLEEAQKETAEMKKIMRSMMEMMRTLQTQHGESGSSSSSKTDNGKGILPTPIHIEPQTPTQTLTQTPISINPNTTEHSLLPIIQSQTQIWPRLDFPIFDGTNPRAWLRRCSKIFQVYQVKPESQVETAAMFLDTKPDIWFQEWKDANQFLNGMSL